MKSILVFAGTIILASCIVSAQDVMKVAPSLVKVLLENENVRVLDFNLKKGDMVPMHSHLNQTIYCIASGKSKTGTPDGKSTETEFKVGEARWSGPITHSNEALTDLHVIVIEMKETAKMEKKMEEKK